jgi:predicted outer membrane repeat protein
VISGLTFMAGLADKGGGILLEQQAQPVIRNLLLYNNRADQGGGLYSYSPVALIDTRVIRNGAIHGGGGAYIGMTATLTGGEFFANESWGDGGGVYLEQAATITGTKFGDNHGSNGGGLFADLNAYPGLWVLTNTEFFGNVAQAGGGAALFGTAQITVQIYGGRYENNTASTFGGGLFGDRATLSGTRFISNSAVNSGGGALVYDASVSGALFERNSVSAGDGGGLMVHNLLLRHTTFVSNTASVNGGGLYASDAVTLTNASFISNSADGGAGVFVAGEATVIDSQFTDNAAQSASYAGGLYGYLLHVTNTQFISNSSGHAGGLQAIVADIHNSWFERNTSRGFGGAVAVNDLIMSNTVLIANTSGGGGGGAWVPGNATIIGGRIENNRALGTNPEWSNGGGLLAEFGSLSISGTQFISNSAFTYGGGLSFSSLSNGRIVNALFSRNSASLDGAALASTSGGHLDLVNTTIADTALNPRFAITVLSGTLGITNTIITNHAIGISNTGGTVTEDYNLFHGNLTNTIGVTTGAHSLVGDPRFVDPAHDDYHLVFGSAGIDHGVDAGVYTDLDGSVRPHGVGFDIGAYEYQGMNYRVFLPLIQK